MTVEILFASVGGLIGAYVSLKVSQAVLKERVDTLRQDVNAAFGKIRELQKISTER